MDLFLEKKPGMCDHELQNHKIILTPYFFPTSPWLTKKYVAMLSHAINSSVLINVVKKTLKPYLKQLPL